MIAVSDKLDAPTNLTPLGNVPVSALPPEFQDLLDPSKPLRFECFAPIIAPAPFWILGFVMCTVCTVFLTGIVIRGLTVSDALMLIALGVLFALGCGAFWFLLNLKSKYKSRVESGRLRLGLFVHPNALLVRRKENCCFLLPRDFLRGVTITAMPRNRHCKTTLLTFVDADGNQYPQILGTDAFGIVDRFDHYEDLEDALRLWKPELEIVKK